MNAGLIDTFYTMWSKANRYAVLGKILLAPLGVGALLYWISNERSLAVSADPFLLMLGASVALVSILPFALRMRVALNIVGFRVSEINSIRILTQSMFYYFFVPLSVGTEVSKFAKLKYLQPKFPIPRLVSAIILDHIIGFLVLVGLAFSLYVAIEPVSIVVNQAVILIVACGTLLGCVAFGIYCRNNPKQPWLDTLQLARNNKLRILQAVCYSVVMHLLIAAAVYAGALTWQVDISYLQILFVLTGAFLFQMLPFNVIGVSAIEFAGAGLYMSVGLSFADALSLVSLLYCYRILIAMLGGAWEIFDAWKEQSFTVKKTS